MNNRIATAGALILCALALPAAARAGTCEDTFIKKGSVLSGQHYIAMVSVPDMPPAVAINQLRGIVSTRGYTVIAAEPEGGAMLIEQPMNGNSRAIPAEVNASTANGVGTVQVEVKLRTGQTAKADAVKTELCGMLYQLKGGKAGRLAAASGAKAVTSFGAPLALSAQAFSQQISKDAERNPLTIPQRYTGRQFTLSGTVDYITRDGSDIRVAYKILQPHELALRLPGLAKSFWSISCMMGPGTSVYSMQLKPGKSIKLTGTFDEYSDTRDVVWFKNCTPAK